jgi:hypothetical protein
VRLFISYTRIVYQISELFYADNPFILSSVSGGVHYPDVYIHIYDDDNSRDDSLANMGSLPHRLYVLDDSKAHTGSTRDAQG